MGALTKTASYVAEGATGAKANWDVKVVYAEGAMGVTVATDESDDWNVDVPYDMGNGMNLFIGADDGGEDTYAGLSYDLGGVHRSWHLTQMTTKTMIPTTKLVQKTTKKV